MAYFFVINLIITAVISGIIIDTFSAMRQQEDFMNQDIDDRCFICNIDRDDFEKLGINFNRHTLRDHNMWKYLQFRLYLESIDVTEMTGQETYVHEILSERKISFYPIKKALVIEGRAQERKDLPSLFVKVDKLARDFNEF